MGLMTTYMLAALYGGAHLKALETCKNAALRKARGNLEEFMVISEDPREDIERWVRVIGKVPDTILKKGGLYCILRSVKPLQPTLTQVCGFLRMLAQGDWVTVQ